MVSIVLALVSAITYGTSDFLAGLMTRRASVFVVTFVGQASAGIVTWFALLWAGGPLSSGAALWGVAAGSGAWLGTIFLYRGLARGSMSVVGPVSAVIAAAGSALVGVLLGDRLSGVESCGVLLACAAIALVSVQNGEAPSVSSLSTSGLLDAIAAGVGFAALFVSLNRAGTGSGVWPVAIGQATGLGLVVAVVAVLGLRRDVDVRTVSRVWTGAVPAGLLGGAATIAFFYATQAGLLSVSAVIASLYPAATVALAIAFLHERVRRIQRVGLGLAAVAVALLAIR